MVDRANRIIGAVVGLSRPSVDRPDLLLGLRERGGRILGGPVRSTGDDRDRGCVAAVGSGRPSGLTDAMGAAWLAATGGAGKSGCGSIYRNYQACQKNGVPLSDKRPTWTLEDAHLASGVWNYSAGQFHTTFAGKPSNTGRWK